MEQNVIISIRGDQDFEETGKDTTEFMTEGTLSTTNYGYLLEYDESELTGMEGTHTAFQIRPKSVALVRTGAFKSQMIFEDGKKHYSLYKTPYGPLTLDIITSYLHTDFTENSGAMEIRYAIEIDHQVTGESCFKVKVRPKTEGAPQQSKE